MQITVIKREDPGYPENLRAIHDPPAVLYAKGGLLPQDRAAVALVGTRRATYYGLSTCEKLAYELASRGITVVSGMALGIDTAAHRGALRAKGRTIAVLGSGHGNIYPRRNRALYEEIAKNGAVISEFSHYTEPFRWNFPQRNRIISGLSLGVVVVEAPKRSGALITADFALEQGREVFALPGKISSRTSEGTHHLIKQGAKLVGSADDIIDELEVHLKNTLKKSSAGEPTAPVITEEEGIILKQVGDEPKYVDVIAHQSGVSAPVALRSLTQLTIRKLIKELPGKKFVRD